MRTIEQIQQDICAYDMEAAKILKARMDCVSEAAEYRKAKALPVLKPEQEREYLKELFDGNTYEQELMEIFQNIWKQSKRVQSKTLFRYNIALIGFMGAGKSTVSHCLKEMLAMDEVDTDAMVVEAEGMEITDIFEKYGEPYFRNCERNAILSLQNRRQLIISCGGGAVMRDENVENLKKSSRIVLLTATPETTLERVKNSVQRPILNGNMNVEFISQLMEKRREQYEKAADIVVQTDGKDVASICEELILKLSACQ